MNGLNIFEKEQGQEAGDKKQGTRDREQGTGNKKQGTRNREQEAGKQKTSSQTDPQTPNHKLQTNHGYLETNGRISLHQKKRSERRAHAVAEIHAQNEPHFTDHVFSGGGDYYF
jgi:hypothetical protein